MLLIPVISAGVPVTPEEVSIGGVGIVFAGAAQAASRIAIAASAAVRSIRIFTNV